MTVCIGAVCENGSAVVVAADRMMTYGNPLNLQVEMAVKKIVEVSSTAVILFSGAVPDGEEVISRVKKQVSTGNPTVQSIATAAQTAYQEVKKRRVEDQILRPFLGVDFNGFGQMVVQSAASQVMAQILGMISQHNLNLDLLIAGLDDQGGHLFAISNPGVLAPLDTVGCAAIGSGGLHANIRLSLGGQGRAISISGTVHNVYEAKAAAEVAPGVGKRTDMAIITEKGVRFFDESAYRVLSGLRRDYPELPEADLKSLKSLCTEEHG